MGEIKTDVENELEDYLNKDGPLSEETRHALIDHAITHRGKLDTLSPNMGGFTDYLLGTLMNDECLRCSISKTNLGKCYGKIGGNPCLVFKKKESDAPLDLI